VTGYDPAVDGTRSAEQVCREILAVLEAMGTLVDYVPQGARRPVDLTGLDAAFGHDATVTGTPG
jgi:adenylate kinase